ncbi:hypothetical protein HMPREF3293_01352 [Christensenella minuta]|uniref:Uncharacterized protein n=1 Tax=Christensenella minuta TaxID=626937 RepID=A0A136Q5D5_9FIRM|nr:hypothetical protein HMPREF3293_01352 [Christensenella minuta]
MVMSAFVFTRALFLLQQSKLYKIRFITTTAGRDAHRRNVNMPGIQDIRFFVN